MAEGPVYAADPPELRRLVVLDALSVIFHRPSGQTHIVDSPAPEILAALGEGPADAAAVLARLARDHDIHEGSEAEAALAARLEELVAAGLVWRA